jgi:hypothetical protein
VASLAEAFIRVRADLTGFRGEADRELHRAGQASGKRFGVGMHGALGGMAGKVFAPLAAAAGGLALGAFFKGAIEGASNTQESMSKVGVVFGKSAGSIKAFAATSSTALGLSNQAALEAAGSLGNLFVALKLPQQQAASMSTKMVTLAGDLASFNNVPVEDALAALKSGLVGETEPLRAFGVNMNDATLRTQALKDGLISNTKEAMSPAVKAQAAYALILAQTGTAQGDFARTSDGLANRQRILSAQWTDMKAKLGAQLLPVAVSFAGVLADKVLPALSRLGTTAKAGFGELSAGIKGTGDGKGTLESLGNTITTHVTPAVQNLATWFRNVAIPALKNFGGYIRDTVIPVIQRIAGNVIPAAVAAFNHVRDAIQRNRPELEELWAGFKKAADFIITKVVPVMGPILAGTLKGMGWLIGNVITTIGRIIAITKLWWQVTGPVLKFVAGAFLTMAGSIIHSAAVAFGWMGSFGAKLKKADKEFQAFARSIKNQHDNVIPNGKTITIQARGYGRQTTPGGRVTNVPFAEGGPVPSVPGSKPNRDSVPAVLMPGEYVVRKDGGNLRDALRYFGAPGYAAGGPVVKAAPITGKWAMAMEGVVTRFYSRLAQTFYDKLEQRRSAPLGAGRTGAYGGVLPHVAASGDAIARALGIRSIGGRAGRPGNYSDHPRGLALDFMVGANTALGNRVANVLTTQWLAHKIKYLIWNARYAGSPGRWSGYSHPLGWTDPTSMHRDHVHASYKSFDKGGWLNPGLTLAYNGTGKPERVGRGMGAAGGITITGDVILQGVQDPAALVKALQSYVARNGPIRLAVRT